MPAVKTLKRVIPRVWIPPIFTANYKLTVERKDGTIDDITTKINRLEIEDGVTETIGRFEFELWNPNEVFNNAWTGNEIVRYFSDYATEATTLRFRGRIEKPSNKNNKIRVTGRSESLRFLELTVTKSFSDQETSIILKDLISTYAPGFTSTNVQTSTTNITVDWTNKTFWEAALELAEKANFDIYVDANLDFHYFPKGSITNVNEAIVHGMNLLDVGEFAPDLTQVKNRIIVYGASQQGVQDIYTSNDTTSQTDNILREDIVNDSGVVGFQQSKDLADARLASKKDPPQIGDVQGILLATLQPGEKIMLSSPQDNIPPSTYNVISYKHSIDTESILTTTVKINKEPRLTSHVVKGNIESGDRRKETSINPEEMRFSLNFLFDEDEGTNSNTEIVGSALRLQSGESSGNWVSPTRTVPSNVTDVYLIVNGDTVASSSFDVSANAGVNFDTGIELKTKTSLVNSIGTQLQIRVNFTSSATQITSLSLLYNLE